ncbi:TonB-dependent receptor domain-containing protein [Flavobacterium myungsuense]|uniref:TonB-dependent receptor domain-containing protein n=1 Tax=Flavobacterium myungsuense TaxID=651823 RepID=A0ABW3J0N9_9FLAO
MFFRKEIASFILFFFITSAFAQKSSFKGIVIDNQTLEPIEYASVSLVSQIDNSVVSGVITGKNGNFVIQNIQSGNYKIKIYFIGYEIQYLENILLKNNQVLNLDTFKLQRSNQSLEEVIIKGTKSNFYNKIDKQQYKADQFATANGGTAIDVIKNLPSVTVNGQGEISLRGSNGFMILVNGKPVLSDAQTLLSQLPANTIENIELITSPSAKYDPDGKGGIINIITKNNKNGIALISNLSGGLPSINDYDNLEKPKRFGGDITFNYRTKKFDITISGNYLRNDVNGYREGNVFTKNFINNTITRFPSNGERSFDKYNYGTKTAISYTANKNDVFNFGFFIGKKFQARRADIVYNNSTSDLNTNALISENAYFNSNVQTKEGTFTLTNLDYTHTFANKSNLMTSLLYENADLYGNTINKNLDLATRSIVLQEVNNPYKNPIDGFRFKLDYSIPIGLGKLESGYQYRFDQQNGKFDYIVTPISVQPDAANFRGTAKSVNHINGFYSQYSGKTNKLDYIAGLRCEYSSREVVLSTDSNPHLLKLSNLFPSANLLYTFNTYWNAKLGYSKRIQRNNNFELNPIPEREHSETLEQGDPDLKPQFVDLVELGMNHSFKKGTLFATLYYQNIKNPIQRVNSVYADTILNRVFTNAEKARLLGLEFGTNLKPVKWFSLYLGGNIYNYKITGKLNILGITSNVDNSNWAYSLNTNSTFNLDKTLSLTANINYTSAKPTAQGEDSRFLSPNLSAKKTILKGNGTIGIQWQNINFGNMGSNQQRITTFGADFYTTTNYTYETNVLLLNFSYNFNKISSKNKLPTSEIGEKEF